MTNQNQRNSIVGVLGGLGWPLILGAAICAVFYVLVFEGPLANVPGVLRYFAGHPVSMISMGMFCVGMAALAIKMLGVASQFATFGKLRLPAAPLAGQSIESCGDLLDGLDALPPRFRDSYLGRRLRVLLECVERKGSAEGLEDEIKYRSDLDAARQQDSYALVRIIIWATPMLGFLGTVIGITQALGDLDAEVLASDPQTAMNGLLAGLYVAFDTTALALTLSIVLMFVQFLIDRFELQLLQGVDEQVEEELAGRFPHLGSANDPHLASIERMSQSVVQSTDHLVKQQVELWQTTIDAAHRQWSQLVQTSTEQMQTALAGALDESLDKHASRLAEVEREGGEQARRRFEQWQTVLSDNARIMQAQQTEMAKQGETMSQVLAATSDVIKLEQALNDNLRLLSGARNFEDTVMSLSAAIHLLNTRLTGDTVRVDLGDKKDKHRAA